MKTIAFMMGLLIVQLSIQVNAQESGINEKEPNEEQNPLTSEQLELLEAQNRRDIAEAQFKEAEFNLKLENLGNPESTTTGVEGTIEIDSGAGYYSELLSFEALNEVSEKISNTVNEILDKNTNIVIGTNFDLSKKYQLWLMLEKQLGYLQSAVGKLLNLKPNSIDTESVGSLLALTTGTLGAITDISKFFKTNRKISKVEFELSTNALYASIANALINQDSELQVYLQSVNFSSDNQLIKKIDEILQNTAKLPDHKLNVYEAYAPFIIKYKQTLDKISQKKNQLKKESDDTKKKKLQKEIEQLELDNEYNNIEIKKWEIISTQFDSTIKLVNDSIDTLYERQNNQPSLLELVSEIELIESLDNPHVLLIEISSQGGEVEITKGALFRKSKVTYLGGIVVSYLLLDSKRLVENSGVLSSYKTKKYKSLSDINEDN